MKSINETISNSPNTNITVLLLVFQQHLCDVFLFDLNVAISVFTPLLLTNFHWKCHWCSSTFSTFPDSNEWWRYSYRCFNLFAAISSSVSFLNKYVFIKDISIANNKTLAMVHRSFSSGSAANMLPSPSGSKLDVKWNPAKVIYFSK